MGETNEIVSQGTCFYDRTLATSVSDSDLYQVEARLAVKAYRDSMPFVDQGDRNSAHFDIFAGKCKRRYHRRPFQWHLSFVGLNNVLVLFDSISPVAERLKKRWNNNGLGYKVSVFVQPTY